MITLYQFPPDFGLPVSVSPFCAKLEVYLRLTGREYETAAGNPMQSPTKTVPYVDVPGQNEPMGDSKAIIAALEAEGPALDGELTDEQRAEGERLAAFADNHLYFGVLYSRFIHPPGWEHQKGTIKKMVPWLLSPVLVPIIRRGQVKRCHEAGHTSDDASFGPTVADIATLSEALGDKAFFLGDSPHVVDCALFGPLVQAATTKSDNPITNAMKADQRLMDWLRRTADRANLSLPF